MAKKEFKFKPLNDNVLVRLVEKTVSDGGVFLPTNLQVGIATGVVIDVSSNIEDCRIMPKDTIYFHKGHAFQIQPKSNQYLVPYKNLLAKAA